MGAFDDLIPSASGSKPANAGASMFGDLIPSKPAAASPAPSRRDAAAPPAAVAPSTFLGKAGNVLRGAGERVGDLAAGVGDTTIGLLVAAGLDPTNPFVANLRRGTEKARDADLGYEEMTSWEDVKNAPLSSVVPFAIEQLGVSVPDMAGAIAALPAYVYARTGELADARAENNGIENATFGDLLKTLPAAVASAAFERFGAKGMLGIDEVATTAVREIPEAIGRAAVKEAGTEAGQEGLESTATTLGTDKGFNLAETGEQMLAGAVGGGFGGAGVRAATSTGEVVTNRRGAFDDLLPEGATPADQVLDPVAGETETAVPVPVDRERLSSPRLSDEDRASPIPNDLIDDGKSILEGRTIERGRLPDPVDLEVNTPVGSDGLLPGRTPILQPEPAIDDEAFSTDIEDAILSADAADFETPDLDRAIREDVDEDRRQSAAPEPSFLRAFNPEQRTAYMAAPGSSRAITRALGDKIDAFEANGETERGGRLRTVLSEMLGAFGITTDPSPTSPPTVDTSAESRSQLATMRAGNGLARSGDGSRRAPVAVASAQDLDGIASRIASPTPAQAEAGNYAKGHARWQGLDIAIETPKGGKRSGTERDGTAWEVTMPAHYGDFKGTRGADGDPIDVYVGDDPGSDRVFVVDQKDADTGKFDEVKVFVGVTDEADVSRIYDGAFSDGRAADRVQAITETTVAELKEWLASGKTMKAFGQKPAREAALAKKPVTAMLRQAGGVDPTSTFAGELRSMGINPRTAPGLFKAGGRGAADNFVRAEHPLFENGPDDGNGYIPEGEILEALRREMAGDPLRSADQIVAMESSRLQEEVNADFQARAERQRSPFTGDPAMEVDRLIDVYGFPDDAAFVEMAISLIERGADPEDAMIAASERLMGMELEPDETSRFNDAVGIPFLDGDSDFDTAPLAGLPWESEPDAEAMGAGVSRAESDGEGEAGARRGVEPAAEGRGSERTPDLRSRDAEAGADGRQQLVIPGAERASDRDIAQRRANAPMRAKAPQANADDGLFGSSGDQLDLVDAARAPETASKTEAAPPVASSPAPKPKLAKMSDRLRNYFQPGRVVDSYGGGKDEILSFNPEDRTVVVRDTATGRERSHSTMPSTRELAAWERANPVPIAEKPAKKKATVDAEEGALLSERPADLPVAVLDGSELGVEFRGPEDMPALRIAARRWYDENLRGSTVTMADGSTVAFNQRGRNKTVAGNGDVLLRSVPAIRAIIENGREVMREPGDRPHVVERIVLAAPVELDGVVRRLAVTIHRTADGQLHYDFHTDRDAGGPGSGARLAYRENPIDSKESAAGSVDAKPRDRGEPLNGVEPQSSLEAPLRRVDGLNLFEPPSGFKDDAPAGWGEVDATPQPRLSETEQQAVLDIVRRVAGLSEVEFHDTIRVPTSAKGFEAWGREAREGQFVQIAGYYHVLKDAVGIALDAVGDGSRLAYHESFHRLQNVFLTDQEKALLAAETETLRAIVASDPGRADQAPRMTATEIEAEAFAIYSERMDRGEKIPLRIKGRIRAAWDRIRAMARRVRNYLSGRGYQTFDDVFEAARSGEVSSRENARQGDAAAMFDIGPDVSRVEPQQKAQSFLSKGQPIDRAMAAPFDFVGGFTKDRRWKPGQALYDRVEKAITTARFSPEGHFSWMNGALDTARAGLIDRYGLDPAYVERDQARSMDERRVMMQGAEVLKTLADQKVSVEEAKVLQAILTGEAVDNAAMQKLAEPIRVAIDELGQEAVQLGLLSAESFERNRGAYLHRVYLKHESEQNGLTRMASRIMGNSRKKILGDQFKGRGMFFEVPLDRLTKDDPEWAAGRRGTPQKGEKVRILDEVQSDMLGGKDKSVRRVYWPADQKVPERYAAFRDQGTWEIRGRQNGRFVLWRDYTKAERGKMGEILDARYTIGKTYMMMSHDLATGRFYQDIAKNEEWARTSEPEGKWKNAADVKRLAIEADLQWVRVPDTAIPNSGGKKRWGALSGQFVRAEIWRDLNEIEVMNQPTVWRMLLSQWKANKTLRSPVVHMNNVMSNLMFMDFADVRFQDLAAGIRSYAKGDRLFEEAVENGAFGSDMMSQEIKKNVLQPILDELAKSEQGGTENSFLARAGLLGKIADQAWGAAKAADKAMFDAYRIEDEIFRMATYVRRRELGDDAKTAAEHARQQFLEYDIRAPWVNAARNTVLPFLSYTYRATPIVAKAIATRPWKLAKYFAVAYAVNALAYAWDDDGDEEKERASLRDEEQGWTWLGVPRMLRMPFRNDDGLPVFLDIRRWIPSGDVFDMNQGASALPVPAPLQFGGPLMMAFELALNKQAFTGEEITNALTDTTGEKAQKVGDYLWKSWLPSAAWIPGSWYWDKIGNSAKGATDSQGRPYGMTEAVASSVGIKLKPQDVEAGLGWQYFALQKTEEELRVQARRLARQRERNLISQDAFESGMARILEKVGRVGEKATELQRVSGGRSE